MIRSPPRNPIFVLCELVLGGYPSGLLTNVNLTSILHRLASPSLPRSLCFAFCIAEKLPGN
jgi:hypothetical protein